MIRIEDHTDNPAPPSGPYAAPALRRDIAIAVFTCLVNMAMVYPIFFPALKDIGGWDEAGYVERGKELAGGALPQFAHNPAVAALYAVTYLPFRNSSLWLVHSAGLARLVLFVLLWLASYVVAGELIELASPLILVAFVAVAPALIALLHNGSDALFAAFSTLGLWQILSFQRTRRSMHLAWCSAFVGLAALSRPEGALLFLTFGFLVVCVSASDRLSLRSLVTRGMSAGLPFMLVVGGYVAGYSIQTGNVSLGVAERSYLAFEQGQGIAFATSYGSLNPFIEGQKDAERLFGTAEQNNYSVPRAIRRNPTAYILRIPRLARGAISELFAGLGWHFGVFCVVFAARGIFELLLRRSFARLAILLLWPASSIMNILVIYQASHLLIPFVPLLAFASIGVTATVRNLDNRNERWGWSIAMVAVIAFTAAVYSSLNDLLFAPLLVVGGLWLIWLVNDWMSPQTTLRMAVSLLVMLAVGLVMRLGIVHGAALPAVTSPEEQATAYLRSHFRPGTRIGTYAPEAVWEADLVPVTMLNVDLATPDQLAAWIAQEHVEAIYVDDELRRFEPITWETLRVSIGESLDVGFEKGPSRPGDSAPVTVLVPHQ